MCEYCEGKTFLILHQEVGTSGESVGLYVAVMGGKLFLGNTEAKKDEDLKHRNIGYSYIRFCPMCGEHFSRGSKSPHMKKPIAMQTQTSNTKDRCSTAPSNQEILSIFEASMEDRPRSGEKVRSSCSKFYDAFETYLEACQEEMFAWGYRLGYQAALTTAKDTVQG